MGGHRGVGRAPRAAVGSLADRLEQPYDLPTLANLRDVNQQQARVWVKEAIKEGALEKAPGSKPLRYILSRQQRLPLIGEAEADYLLDAGKPLSPVAQPQPPE